MEHASIDRTGASKGTLGSYLAGFILALILTVIPFGLVMNGSLPRGAIIFSVFAAASVQILVHLHYFLHLDRSSDERWNVLAIFFTALAIVIVVGGSLWIMYNLHYNMSDHPALSVMASRWLS